MLSLQITPDPDDAEREAILEALAAEDGEGSVVSHWAAELLPHRDGEEREP